MNSEYGQSSSRENSVEQRKPMEELKRMNQSNSALANTPPQMMQPIVIQCDLPQAMNKLAEQADGINWELEEIRKTLPELKPYIDLTPVQQSLAEMQRSLTEMNKLTEQADGINWELEEIRKTLPELKPHIDLTPVQQSLTEMQKSLTEMNRLLERVGNLSERHSSKWIDWLPDFSLLVALKWIMLVLILGTAALAGWYGAAAIRGLFL